MTDTSQTREWAQGIARREGKRIAAVALARRLGGILYACGGGYSIRPTGGDEHRRDDRSSQGRLNSRSRICCVRLEQIHYDSDG